MLSVSEPTLLVRRGSFLISFGELRAIVTAARVFVLLPQGDEGPLAPLLARLAEVGSDKEVTLPFELRVLEAVLVMTINQHLAELETSWRDSKEVLSGLRESRDVTPALLNGVFVLKGRSSLQLTQVSGMQEALERVQRDEVLMAGMNLTPSKSHHNPRHIGHHRRHIQTDHVEILLDTYALELQSMGTRLSLILKQIDATEDLLNLRLENIQKNTFIANTLFHLVLALLGVPAVVASFLGMNLWSGAKFALEGPDTPAVPFTPPDYPADRYDDDPSLGVSWIFLYNSVGVLVITVVVFAVILAYIRNQGLVQIRL